MLSNFFALFIVISITGCASSYKLSDKGTVLKQSMTQRQAEDILKEVLYSKKDTGRLFVTNTEVPICGNAKVVLNNSIMTYDANYIEDKGSDVSVNVVAGTAQVDKRYVIKAGRFDLKLNEITKIRLWKTTNDTFKVPCSNVTPGYYVIVHQNPKSAPIFNVSIENLDRLLAALLYYSPSVGIKEGLGL